MFTVRCAVCNMTGDFENAKRYMGESLEASRSLNLGPQAAWSLAHTALSLTYMTRFAEAKEKLEEAIQFAESIGDLAHLSEALAYPAVYCYMFTGDLDKAQASAERAFSIATQNNIAFSECMATASLSALTHMRGDYEKAIEYNHLCMKAAQASGYGFMAIYPLCNLGNLYLEINPKLKDKTFEYHSAAQQVMRGPAGGYGLGWREYTWVIAHWRWARSIKPRSTSRQKSQSRPPVASHASVASRRSGACRACRRQPGRSCRETGGSPPVR